jgi:hypothetical protein
MISASEIIFLERNFDHGTSSIQTSFHHLEKSRLKIPSSHSIGKQWLTFSVSSI